MKKKQSINISFVRRRISKVMIYQQFKEK